MGKTINLLTRLTDTQANDNNRLSALADPVSGEAGGATTGQLKLVIGTQKVKYVATGSEGTTLTISALAGRIVLLVTRESGIIHEVISPTVPDPAEYSFNSTDITLGLATNPGERFTILYKNA